MGSGSTTASTSRSAAAPPTSASCGASARPPAAAAIAARRARARARDARPPRSRGCGSRLRCISRASLLATRPLSPRERIAAVRAALALKRLDPDDAALDAECFGDWLRAHGQTPERDRGALEPDRAADTQPAGRRGVARRARSRSSAPASSTPPTPPTSASRRHRSSGSTPTRPRPRSRRGGPRPPLEPGAGPTTSTSSSRGPVVLAVPHHAAAEFVPVDVDGARRQPDRQPARALRPARARRAAGGGTRLAGAVRLRPHAGVRARARGSCWPSRSRTPSTRSASRSATLRERYLPALERLLPAARGAAVLDFARRTSRARPFGPRRARGACGPDQDDRRGSLPGGRVDGHRLAGDDGGRGAQRPRRRTRRARARDRERGARMSVDDRAAPAARPPGRARARDRAPALAPAPGRLVEGRARDQRDDRRRGHLPAPLPRHPRRRRDDAALRVWIRSKQRARRLVGDLLRRARPTSRRRSRRTSRSGSPATRPEAAHMRRARRLRPRRGRGRAHSRLHPHVALAALALVVGRRADAAAGADPAARRRRRSRSTRSAAGRGRRSWRSGRDGAAADDDCRLRDSRARTGRSPAPATVPGRRFTSSTGAAPLRTAPGRRAAPQGAGRRPSAGSSNGRSATAPGAASSRRGSGR